MMVSGRPTALRIGSVIYVRCKLRLRLSLRIFESTDHFPELVEEVAERPRSLAKIVEQSGPSPIGLRFHHCSIPA